MARDVSLHKAAITMGERFCPWLLLLTGSEPVIAPL
jgi:hypothetical protein